MTEQVPVPVVQVERRKKPPKDQLPRTSLFTAVVGVIAITILSIACTTFIVLRGGEAPEGLVATSGVGLGALSAFLARGQGNT
jgi:hypothetical protein